MALLVALATGAPLGPPPAAGEHKSPEARRELFSAEDWYKGQPGTEETFVGVLQRASRRGGLLGIGRFNPYCLALDGEKKPAVREVYSGGKPDLLAPYVGKKVKLIGKAVDMEVEGTNHHEIWPARVELSAAEGKDEPGEENKPKDGKSSQALEGRELRILAQLVWRPLGPRTGQQQLVIRTTKELGTAMGLPADKVGDATAQQQAADTMARLLKVGTIDWKTQMLVLVTGGTKPTGGYSVEITGLTVKDKTLTVRWMLHGPKPGQMVIQAFTHPATLALVERFDGPVTFDPPATAGKEDPDLPVK